MISNPNHIFVDTNVLNGFYLERTTDVECLKYLFSLKGKKLFISALSIGQLVAFFHRKFANDKMKEIIRYLFTKFTIIEFNEHDIQKTLLYDYSDMEDTIQYVIGTKMKCFYFITNDKHFNTFLNISVLKPSEIRKIKK
jgi:predicted nucleic-acid-binding protein